MLRKLVDRPNALAPDKHFLGAVVMATVVACGTPTEPIDVLRIAVAADPAVVDSSNVVMVTVTVTNPMWVPITVATTNSCQLQAAIRDSVDARVDHLVLGSCFPGPYDLTIDPGQTVTQPFAWPAEVSPGSYTVIGVLNTVDGILLSAPVTLVVN